MLQREAFQLQPSSHLDCPLLLNNLAIGLFTRFEQVGGRTDLHDAARVEASNVSVFHFHMNADMSDERPRYGRLVSKQARGAIRTDSITDGRQVMVWTVWAHDAGGWTSRQSSSNMRRSIILVPASAVMQAAVLYCD